MFVCVSKKLTLCVIVDDYVAINLHEESSLRRPFFRYERK